MERVGRSLTAFFYVERRSIFDMLNTHFIIL